MENSRRQFAVVTGASSGIGLELAKQFARNGFDLLIAAEDAGLQAAVTQLQGLGSNVDTCQVDLATPEGVEKLAGRIASGGRALDAISVNAGVGVSGKFAETPLEGDLNLIDLNVRSTVHLTKRVLPAMLQRGTGKILITSSVAADMTAPYEAVYSASKAFDKSFAASLRNELKDTGVTVSTLMPGPTETNFFHRAGMDDTQVGQSKKFPAEEVARMGFEGLMAGKHEIVAGSITTKFQDAVARITPEEVSASQHAKMAAPAKN